MRSIWYGWVDGHYWSSWFELSRLIQFYLGINRCPVAHSDIFSWIMQGPFQMECDLFEAFLNTVVNGALYLLMIDLRRTSVRHFEQAFLTAIYDPSNETRVGDYPSYKKDLHERYMNLIIEWGKCVQNRFLTPIPLFNNEDFNWPLLALESEYRNESYFKEIHLYCWWQGSWLSMKLV